MELIWERAKKEPDENHVTFAQADVEYLWNFGFVDTAKISLSAWSALFEPCKQPAGNFVVSREEFIAKEEYRYKGEVMVPFDAMLINEGKYAEDGWQDLLEQSIAPSCGLSAAELHHFSSDLKKEFRSPADNLVIIERAAKERIKKLLDEHPSPLRRLELIFDDLFRTMSNFDMPQTAEEIAAAEATFFTTMPTSVSEEKSFALKDLQKAQIPKQSAPVKASEKDTVKLGKIKRSRKGFRG